MGRVITQTRVPLLIGIAVVMAMFMATLAATSAASAAKFSETVSGNLWDTVSITGDSSPSNVFSGASKGKGSPSYEGVLEAGLVPAPAPAVAVGADSNDVMSVNDESTALAATASDNTSVFSTPTAGVLIVGATDGASFAVPSVVGGEYLVHGQRGIGPRMIVAIFTPGGEVAVTWPDRSAAPSTIDSFFYPTELVPVGPAVGGGGYAPVADLGLQKNTEILLTAWMARSVSGDGTEVGFMSLGRLAEGRIYESEAASAEVGFPHWVGVAIPLGEEE